MLSPRTLGQPMSSTLLKSGTTTSPSHPSSAQYLFSSSFSENSISCASWEKGKYRIMVFTCYLCLFFRYFHYFENVIEWSVLVLVIFSLLPNYFIKFESSKQVQKHLAAFTFLLAFMQVGLISRLQIIQILYNPIAVPPPGEDCPQYPHPPLHQHVHHCSQDLHIHPPFILCISSQFCLCIQPSICCGWWQHEHSYWYW